MKHRALVPAVLCCLVACARDGAEREDIPIGAEPLDEAGRSAGAAPARPRAPHAIVPERDVDGDAAAEEPAAANEPPPIDWTAVRTCPKPPSYDSCSPQGKHCDCVAYGSLAGPQIRADRATAPEDVWGCIGVMSHAPCPEDGVFRECSRAARAKGLTRAEQMFFSCAARICDGRY